MRPLALSITLGWLAAASGNLAVGQTTLPDPTRDVSGRVAPQGPYRSRMRIVGEDEARPPAPDIDIALEALADDDYGRSLLLRRLGYAEASRGDYASATRRFEEALDTGALDPAALAQIRQNLGALYVASGNFPKAVQTLEPLLAGDYAPTPDTLYALALSYARVERPAEALTVIDRAAAGNPAPPADWLRLRLYAQSKLGRYSAAAATQTQLLGLAPMDDAGWRQLAGLYQAAGESGRAVAALLVAEARGLLHDPADIELIARTQIAAGMPYQAARRLDDALASGALPETTDRRRLNADAWLLAREYRAALLPLERAADLSGDADLFLRLGDIHRELGQWQAAATAYRQVTRRGGPQAARGWLGLGESRYRSGNVRGARAAFRQAAAYGGVYRSAAEWLAFLGADEPAPDAASALADATGVDADAPPSTGESNPPAERVALAVAETPAAAAAAAVDVKQIPAGRYYMTTETVSAQTALKRAVRLARDLRTAVNRQRIAAGGPLHVFLDSAAETSLALSVGVPVRGSAPPSGAFRARRLDAFECAWFLYEGDWDQLPAAWQLFEARVAASGRIATGERRQVIFQRGSDKVISRVELQIGLAPAAAN